MKYLFLSNSIGGLKSFRTEIIERLLNEGHQVHICSPLEINPNFFKDKGCVIHPVKMARHGMNPFSELRVLNDYASIIRAIRPNIILAYTIKPNIYGSIAARLCRVPIIASVTGLGVALERNNWISKISKRLLKFGMKSSDHVFFQNKESMDFFTNNRIPLKSKSIIAGSGVNLRRFVFTDYPDYKNGIHFLYTGRILKEKGVGLYLEAARIIKKEFPDTHFHIVGIKDDDEYSNKVEEFHKKGIIEFHGPQNDVRHFIKRVHCQVHPTYYPEGMSNVLLESAAMGRPAITTDKSGCKEIVDDGKTGFLVKQNDLKSLVDAIRRFILLPESKKEEMGRKAHIKVEKLFDREKVIDEYIKMAQSLTSK